MEDRESVREWMEAAGCSERAIRRAMGLLETGAAEELIRCLCACRCEALEELHVKQKQLDRLDSLIHETRKHVKENAG